MASSPRVRNATLNDASQIAAVHVESWRETYRGLVPDEVLDDSEFLERRTQGWTRLLESGTSNIVLAEVDGEVVGFARSGRARDDDALYPTELFEIYVIRSRHGSGVGGALIHATLGDAAAILWVAQENPRAQAFYRKYRFEADGATKNDGIDEIRMARPPLGPV